MRLFKGMADTVCRQRQVGKEGTPRFPDLKKSLCQVLVESHTKDVLMLA